MDGAWIVGDERTREGRVARAEFDHDHPAEAVADHDRLLDADVCTEPRDSSARLGMS